VKDNELVATEKDIQGRKRFRMQEEKKESDKEGR
jgi:hypothetical protein